jgi:penicillin amidase
MALLFLVKLKLGKIVLLWERRLQICAPFMLIFPFHFQYMRVVPFVVSTVVTAGLVFVFNRPLGPLPAPPGKFFSPQHGFWQNAEPTDQSFNADLHLKGLKGKADVYFDERLVPHVFAENDEDLYFIQGYLHAKFRLFQMDLQTKAAAGRASEIAGKKAINYDKAQRRLGMVYAAQNALKTIEADPVSKPLFDAYTNGINAYIGSLSEAAIPIEYKLLNIRPEKWSNLRTCLLLKMMANMLSSGTENDEPNTNAKAYLLPDELKLLYPQINDSLIPIVPKGTAFSPPGIVPVKPVTADSLYFNNRDTVRYLPVAKPDPDNGSNNWVVAGSRTQSGAPILCNDPHLELSLPSIWYEMQLKTPTTNCYGVSLPGSPFIIIGFNDSIAWGVTNAQRDVKDYYKVKFKDNTRKEYWFNGKWTATTIKVEEIKVKGAATVYDTVAYTVFGPVAFDETTRNADPLAIRWVAHDPSNEGITFFHLNRAKNYAEYVSAISTFSCPAQNFVFASKSGDIAIWQQGKFPARWEGQGLYLMPGEDSSFMWQGFIPQSENPHVLNPERGYLESANQRPADSAYPYFIPGSYITARAISIDRRLGNMTGITPQDMMALQNDYFNVTAEDYRPLLLKYCRENDLNATEKKYLDIFKSWDLRADPDSKGQTVYVLWTGQLTMDIYKDEILDNSLDLPIPDQQTTLEALLKDSAMSFIDNKKTPQLETLFDLVTNALKKAAVRLDKAEKDGRLAWSNFKRPAVYHLLKDNLKAFAREDLHIGGDGNIINAVTHSHGPSWRMIVQLSTPTEAYGVFPGGESGNPGSRFYDNYLDSWVNGKYYKLWFMRDGDRNDKAVMWRMKLTAGSN